MFEFLRVVTPFWLRMLLGWGLLAGIPVVFYVQSEFYGVHPRDGGVFGVYVIVACVAHFVFAWERPTESVLADIMEAKRLRALPKPPLADVQSEPGYKKAAAQARAWGIKLSD